MNTLVKLKVFFLNSIFLQINLHSCKSYYTVFRFLKTTERLQKKKKRFSISSVYEQKKVFLPQYILFGFN